MAQKLKRKKAELFRFLYVLVWTILIALSLLFSVIRTDSGEGNYFEDNFLLPLLLAVVLFFTELCYTFLEEKLKAKYSDVLGVMVCLLLFFAFLFILIISKEYIILEYVFLGLCFIVLGCIKWLKTPLLPHQAKSARSINVQKPELKKQNNTSR